MQLDLAKCQRNAGIKETKSSKPLVKVESVEKSRGNKLKEMCAEPPAHSV
jgi:hypothetical protein